MAAISAPASSPKSRSSVRDAASIAGCDWTCCFTDSFLIEFEFFGPGVIPHMARLFGLRQQVIAYRQIIHAGAHETLVSLRRGADNRLAAHVKRGVHEYPASR